MTSAPPTLKDLGEYHRLALLIGLQTPSHIEAWADSVIASLASPPPVFFDLSTCGSLPIAAINSLLSEIPGHPSAPERPIHLLLGHCWHWIQSADPTAFSGLLLQLYKMSKVESFPDEFHFSLSILEDDLSCAQDRVFGTIEEVRASFIAFLSNFSTDAPGSSSSSKRTQ